MKFLWVLLILLLPLGLWFSLSDSSLSHSPIEWKKIGEGLFFSRVDVLQEGKIVESIAVVRIDPGRNSIRILNAYEGEKTVPRTIEEWQSRTSAIVLINGGQYMADPYLMPVAMVLVDGQMKGPKHNRSVRGMLVTEPENPKLPKADLLDFDYDAFNLRSNSYRYGLQHWPILLDREGKVKVKESGSRANRSVVAKDFDGNILFFTTERGFFTLHEFGEFLKESNQRTDHGFSIHTAMNLDGGNEANLYVRTESFQYLNYGQFKRYASTDSPIFPVKSRLPGVIAVFPR